MRLRPIERRTWHCEPLVAAFVVFRAAATAEGELLIDDLERANPVAKRLQITHDDEVVLEVHCMFDGDGILRSSSWSLMWQGPREKVWPVM